MRRMVQYQGVFRALASACVVSSLIATATWSQTLTWLGVPLEWTASGATSVSADGRVVVGFCFRIGQYHAFRWENGVFQVLGTFGSGWSYAYGVSADGSVVVGYAEYNAERRRAFRWENGVMQDLGTFHDDGSQAYGVSADGSVVVGVAAARAFRWENGVMQNLGTLPNHYHSVAYAVSPDERIVVGISGTHNKYHVVRWVDGVIQDLGTLPNHNLHIAYAVSADGSVVVGSARPYPAANAVAFRWENGAFQNLGTLGGIHSESEAYGVSADGSVVVGFSKNDSGQVCAVRWTAVGGIENLNITYANLLANGSRLQYAYAISPNGRYIVGMGYNAATGRTEAFLLGTQPSCTIHNGDVDDNGCVDDADLLAVLFAFGNTGSNLGRVDVNCDQVVDDADLLIVLFNFGTGC